MRKRKRGRKLVENTTGGKPSKKQLKKSFSALFERTAKRKTFERTNEVKTSERLAERANKNKI